MKKRVHKNQIVITTLAVLIAVAGYVTYDKKGADIKDAETVATVSYTHLTLPTKRIV